MLAVHLSFSQPAHDTGDVVRVLHEGELQEGGVDANPIIGVVVQ